MRQRELLEERLAPARDDQGDAATVGGIGPPGDQALPRHAIHEPDDAVMPQLQSLGQRADRDSAAAGKPLDGEKGLMLLGGEPRGGRRVLAEAQEDPKDMAEVRKLFVLRPRDSRAILRAPAVRTLQTVAATSIISYCDMKGSAS